MRLDGGAFWAAAAAAVAPALLLPTRMILMVRRNGVWES